MRSQASRPNRLFVRFLSVIVSASTPEALSTYQEKLREMWFFGRKVKETKSQRDEETKSQRDKETKRRKDKETKSARRPRQAL